MTVKNKDTNRVDEENNECDELNNDLAEMIVENQTEMADQFEANDEKDMENEQCGSSIETRTATDEIIEEDEDDDDDDDSSSEHELTNLGWLIDLKNLAQWPVDANASNRKNQNGNSHSALPNGITNCIMNDIDDDESTTAPAISEKDLSEERFKKFTIQVKQ